MFFASKTLGRVTAMEKRAKKKKSCGLWIHLFLVAFCVFVVAGVYWQYREYRQLKVELADVEQQIADEQQKTLDFQAKKDYYNSDSYIEQIAREKLGLVKSNEILYINREQ